MGPGNFWDRVTVAICNATGMPHNEPPKQNNTGGSNVGDAADLVETVSKVIENATSNPEVKQFVKQINKDAGIIGDLATGVQLVDKALNTDFSDPEQTADFTEEVVTESVEEASGPAAPIVNVIMEDGKSETGVTNTKNLVRSYDYTYRSVGSYVYQNFTLKNEQSRYQKVKEAERRQQVNENTDNKYTKNQY